MTRICVLSILIVILSGCNDKCAAYDSEDVIVTGQFLSRFKECSSVYKQEDRMSGTVFGDCLASSYNLSKE